MRSRVVLATLVLAMLCAAGPVSAAAGPVLAIRGCAGDTRAAAAADGTVWASSSCGVESAITPDILRTGASWTRRGDRASGRVVSVADDGRYTFTLRSYHGTELQLTKIQHDAGYFGYAGLSRGSGSFTGTVVARDGRYWAVWSERTCAADGSDCRQRLFQQRSLGAAPAKTALLADPNGSEDQPSLVLRGDGVVLAFVRTVSGRRTLRLAVAGLDGAWSEAGIALADGADVALPDLAVSGGRTLLAWSRNGRPALAIDNSWLQFGTRQDLPYRAPVSRLAVAASGGRAFVASSACFLYAGASTCRVYLAETRLNAPVIGSEVSLVARPDARWELEDIVAARGRATVLMDTGSALVSRSP
ncbi:MAG: hypothetical protein JWP11_2803 [Frankiales bacterium]|nr:hypothetical protein [Frankiales bacterium]